MARPHRTASSGLDAVPAVSVGDGVLDAMSDGFAGRVEGVFNGGFYVSGSPQTVFAVLGPQSCPGLCTWWPKNCPYCLPATTR